MTTVLDLQRFKAEGRRFAMLTCYDFTTARLLEEAEIPVLLVGDSLAMVVHGHPTTLPISVDEMLVHCRAVARGAKHALLVGDLPFGSYQASPEDAVRAASRFLSEGGMHAVKLEGGGPAMVATVARLVSVGIPVMAHIGLTPQSVHRMGGFKVQGRGRTASAALLAEARELDAAGAFSIVLEGIPATLATRITAAVAIPTIGIGAGAGCDGQVLVVNDMLGLTTGHTARFVKRFANLGEQVVAAARAYAEEVGSGTFPGAEHSYSDSGPKLHVSEGARYGG